MRLTPAQRRHLARLAVKPTVRAIAESGGDAAALAALHRKGLLTQHFHTFPGYGLVPFYRITAAGLAETLADRGVRECQRCAGTGDVCPRCQCSPAACGYRHERAACGDCKGTGTVPVLFRETGTPDSTRKRNGP